MHDMLAEREEVFDTDAVLFDVSLAAGAAYSGFMSFAAEYVQLVL